LLERTGTPYLYNQIIYYAYQNMFVFPTTVQQPSPKRVRRGRAAGAPGLHRRRQTAARGHRPGRPRDWPPRAALDHTVVLM
jgi:hypothetical protein